MTGGRIEYNWKELLQLGQKTLEQDNIADASLDAWYLLAYVSGMNRADFFLKQEEMPGQEQITQFLELIEQRRRHIPLQHLVGSSEFMGLEFITGPQALIPRQDTETLVEALCPLVKGKRVLDLCTGTGCIAISLKLLGEAAQVDGVDLSEDALALAERNAKKLQADVHFWKSDMWSQVRDCYDIIVSNPPYIARAEVETLMPEVREHEPRMALDGGEDGLDFYRQIAEHAGKHLTPNGMLWLEIGYDQRESVSRLLEQNGFIQIGSLKDLCGKDRVVFGSRG